MQTNDKEQSSVASNWHISDQLRGVGRSTKIGLRSGYHQILLEDSSAPRTAFETHYGHFEFLLRPLGLTNSPDTVMTLMHKIRKEYLDRIEVVYQDEVLV